MSLTVGTDAYVSLSRAGEILETERLHTAAWVAATVEDREAAIRWATQILDSGWDWVGAQTSPTQALAFPRLGLIDREGRSVSSSAIPAEIERGCAQIAAGLIVRDRSSDSPFAGQGIKRAKVGSIEIEVDETSAPDLVPPYVFHVVEVFGSPRESLFLGAPSSVKLRRS